MVKFQQRYVKSHRRSSNAKPFALRFKLASSLRWDWRLLLLTFVPAACFPGSCRKAYPKAFWHRGAPCSPRASRKFGLIYQGSQWILSCWIRARSRHSGSGTTLRGVSGAYGTIRLSIDFEAWVGPSTPERSPPFAVGHRKASNPAHWGQLTKRKKSYA